MQKIAEARRMSKNIISAILLATVIACLRHSHQQQNEMLAAHKDMITKHTEMLMTLTDTHQQHIKLLSKLTQNMAPQEKTEDHDENGYAPGKALLQTTLPRQPTASCESNPGASSTAPAGMGLLAFIGGAGIWHIARRSQAPDARTPRKKKKKKIY